jgi:L-lysine 2,3-aminomutase
MNDANLLVEHVRQHPYVTGLLFTGGDPLIMKTSVLANYIEAVLDEDISHLRTIRIGTKALSFWPTGLFPMPMRMI